MKVRIDKEKCIGCGTCTAVCPKIFVMEDDGKSSVKLQPSIEDEQCVKEAVDSCPTEAILIEEDNGLENSSKADIEK